MHGLPEARPVLGEPPAGERSRAAAGLRAGDTVRAVDGQTVATWQERALARAAGGAAARAGARRGASTSAATSPSRRSTCATTPPTRWRPTRSSASGCGSSGRALEPVLGQVVAGGPAERAGLASGRPHHRGPRACRSSPGRRWSPRCARTRGWRCRSRSSETARHARARGHVPDAGEGRRDAHRPHRRGARRAAGARREACWSRVQHGPLDSLVRKASTRPGTSLSSA